MTTHAGCDGERWSRSTRNTRLLPPAPSGCDDTTSHPSTARQMAPRSVAAVEEVITKSAPARHDGGAAGRHRGIQRLQLLPFDLTAGKLADAVAHGTLASLAAVNQPALERDPAHHLVVADDGVVEVDADLQRHAGRPRTLRHHSIAAATCSVERLAIEQRPASMRT